MIKNILSKLQSTESENQYKPHFNEYIAFYIFLIKVSKTISFV